MTRRLTAIALTCLVALGVAVGASVPAGNAAVAPLGGGVGAIANEPLTPAQTRARSRTTAWIVTWDQARVMASLRAHRRQIGTISPFWYELATNGRKVVTRDGAGNRELLQIAAAEDMRVIPTVTNEFDAARVSAALRTAATRRRHIAQLVALAARPAFGGIDLDYEQVAVADRARFTAFVRDLGIALRARGKVLSISVPPLTANDAGAAASALDLAAIGRAADEVRVLAYDYSFPCGGAGPISPIDWVDDVLAYTLQSMPARKVILGTSLYGYDWPVEGCGKSLTWTQIQAAKRAHSGRLGWSVRWQSRMMRYTANGTAHVVWFDDAASVAAKSKATERLLLRGIAFWRIGGEDPQVWTRSGAILGAQRAR